LQPSRSLIERYGPVFSDGYVNLYALFVERDIGFAKIPHYSVRDREPPRNEAPRCFRLAKVR
jgi:hypothetical protein